jgi:hypothetical protein
MPGRKSSSHSRRLGNDARGTKQPDVEREAAGRRNRREHDGYSLPAKY